jgi:hypothetical protein
MVRSVDGKLIVEKHLAKKKTSEKALIPLPPTGFVSLFYESAAVMQVNL